MDRNIEIQKKSFKSIKVVTLNTALLLVLEGSTTNYLKINKIVENQPEMLVVNVSEISQNLLGFSRTLFKKKLRYKGLGFKINVETEKLLTFKIGLSHIISLEIPVYISKVTVKKKDIVFESNDKILLGDFVEKIYRLKYPDAYKGKGFLIPGKIKKLKEIKKK